MTYRCAIDIGGTFTDLVGVNETTGDVVRAKKAQHTRQGWVG